jgi:hypothetical protein
MMMMMVVKSSMRSGSSKVLAHVRASGQGPPQRAESAVLLKNRNAG